MPPSPVEVLTGAERMYFQILVKKPFSPQSRFEFFTLSTFTSDYSTTDASPSMVIPVQLNLILGSGFRVLAGVEANSKAGFAPITGGSYQYFSRRFTAISTASIALNPDADLKFLGIYEFRPALTSTTDLYLRGQVITKEALAVSAHKKSVVSLRGGVRRGPLAFGAGANLEWTGADREFDTIVGPFVRWVFP